MQYKHQYIDFRISRRTLWVGMHAYPLQNVARVRPRYYIPDRGATMWAFVKRAGTWAGVAAAGWILLACFGSSAPAGSYAVLILAVLAVFALHTVRLVRGLAEPALYALSVETAGDPHMALVSRDEQLIYDLIRRVVDAIDNPAAEFAMTVENIYGDKVDGDKFVGDKVRGDKISS